jgi:tripartite-type tricarboxylate transporter receptor subunit TctC
MDVTTINKFRSVLAINSFAANEIVILALWSVLALVMASPSALAQKSWKPDRPIEIVVGADPGSGFDRTARLLQRIWQSDHLVK